MIETTIDNIMEKAKQFHSEGKKWHFHMLTPDCTFNESDKQAFVLENTTDSEVYVTYSDKRYMTEGKELVQLIHGASIVAEESTESPEDDKAVKEIVRRAEELNDKGAHWHHHMLFPDCIYNKHKGNWCIVFEDPETGKTLEYVSKEEPKEALRKIEVLYYAQKE